MFKKIIKWVLIIFAGLVILGIILDLTSSPEEKAAMQAARQQEQAARQEARQQEQAVKQEEKRQEMMARIARLPVYTSIEISKDYDNNSVAADQKYKGKEFKIKGVVTSINTDLFDNPYILMNGTNQFMEPHFSFSKSHADDLAEVQPGMKLTLVCTGKGDLIKTAMLDKCHILDE